MKKNYPPDTDKLLSRLDDGVLTISFNRPDVMNALHPEMLTGVGGLVEQASADDSVCAVVLQGEGRAFSAGVDLKVLQDIEPAYGRIGDLKGDEALRLGLANDSVAEQEELDELVAKRVAQIAGNSRAAVAAMKDLYRLSQQGQPMEEALVKELDNEYTDILDTAERLAEFR